MNRLEPDIDDKIMKEVSSVDWHRVTAGDASRFGLAVGFFRDAVTAWKQHQAAWFCAVGGVISSAVLASACLIAGTGPTFALQLILTHQVLRTLLLWWKARTAQKFVIETEKHAIDSAQSLTQAYPAVSDAQAA